MFRMLRKAVTVFVPLAVLAGCSTGMTDMSGSEASPKPMVRVVSIDHEQERLSYIDDIEVVLNNTSPSFTVERVSPTALRVILPDGYGFAKGETYLNRDLRDKLIPMAKLLVKYKTPKITVFGHTDIQGNEAYNRRLSKQRAEVISDQLVRHGIEKGRITLVAEFFDAPRCNNTTQAGQECNRRVEILIES